MSTNQEHVLTDTDLIVSKTDLKGIITYINDDFIRIGGYSKKELIGAPHNILRHPDMPKAAFADMWKTLQSGNSWTGIVKNRTKDGGGFYWVRANAMPMLENGRIVGYMSVRTKPSVAEISSASNLYREIQAGRSNVKLDAGEIITPNLLFAIRRTFKNITIKTKLNTLVSASLLALAGIGGYGFYGIGVIKNSSIEISQEIAFHSEGVNLSRAAQADFKSQVQEWKNALLRGQDAATFERYSRNFEGQIEKVNKDLTELNSIMANMPEKDMVASVGLALKEYADMMTKYHAALKNYQTNNINSILIVDAMVKGIDQGFVESIEKLVSFHQTEIEKNIKESQIIAENVTAQFKQNVFVITILLGLILLAWSLATLVSVLTPIKTATQLIHDATEGKEIQLNEFAKNELGRLIQAIKSLSITTSFNEAESRRAAKDMLRIKMGLDEVRMPVTLANSEKELIYMNTAAQKLWNSMSNEISNRFPNFNVDEMLGYSINPYFEKDEEREIFSEQRKEPKIMLINLGGKQLRLTVISIYDHRGFYAGRATQWKDITAEVAIEKQIARIVKDATSGNFRNRVAIEEKDGFFRELADGLNTLLETCEQSYGDIATIFDALSRGDLSQTITNAYTGEFEHIKNNANNTVHKLTDIVEQIKLITHNVNDSSKEIANSNYDLSNRTTTQAAAIEETAASMHELTSMVEANTENSNHANEFVLGASDIATKGVNVIRRVVSTMEDIHESSRKVVDIISVIDGISFQTNILALNAAVEAARAGEQGRGFAVVASEVRSLAQRAAAAAGEIKTLINDSVEKIEDGSKLVIDAGHTMEDIVGSIRTVTQMIGDISAASNEQSAGIGQANKAIVEMEAMTQQNAILVEQSSVTADSLKNQAADLSKAVDYFKMG
jgi:methyl-accepting chemotaxis protein